MARILKTLIGKRLQMPGKIKMRRLTLFTLILMMSLILQGCLFRTNVPICDNCAPSSYVQESTSLNHTTASLYYEDYCADEPYYYAAEWCDWYDDNTTCCVWYSDGWFEEYCQWGYDYCWEYNGSF